MLLMRIMMVIMVLMRIMIIMIVKLMKIVIMMIASCEYAAIIFKYKGFSHGICYPTEKVLQPTQSQLHTARPKPWLAMELPLKTLRDSTTMSID